MHRGELATEPAGATFGLPALRRSVGPASVFPLALDALRDESHCPEPHRHTRTDAALAPLFRSAFMNLFARAKAPQRDGRNHLLVIATVLALLTFAVFAALIYAGNHQH
jgi:hypothetical protein